MPSKMQSMSVIQLQNLPAKELLPEEKKEDKAFYPDAETMKHLEVYEKFDHKWTGKYSDLFLQFKMYRK